MKVLDTWKRSSWKTKTLVVIALLYLIYALVMWLVVPGIVRDQAREALADLTGRQVTIKEVKINPLTLSATVNGFSVADDQTQVLLCFNQLYVNFELSSLFRWSWHFKEVLLDGLTVRAQRNPDNVFSFDDVIEHVQTQLAEADPPAPQEEEADKEAPLPAISIARLALTGGDLRYTEATSEPSQQLVLPVDFTVQNFATRSEENSSNHYVIRIEGPDGGSLDWDGRFDLDPLVADGTLKVNKVDLVKFASLLKNQVRFEVPSGLLDVGLDYHFESEPEPVIRVSNGLIDVTRLVLKKPAADEDSLNLPETRIEGVSIDSGSRHIEIPRIEITNPKVAAVLDKQGVDLATLFLPPDEEKAEQVAEKVKEKAKKAAENIQKAETIWKVKLDHIAINGSQLAFTDQTLSPARTLMLTDGHFALENLVVGDEKARFRWQGKGTLLGSGELAHSGEGQLSPLDIDMKATLAGLPLTPLSPWLEKQAPLSLDSGTLAMDVESRVSGDNPVATLKGKASVQNVSLQESGQPWVKVKALDVQGLSADTGQQTLNIEQLALNGLDVLNKVNKQGQDAASRIATAMPAEAPAAKKDSGKPWQVAVNQVKIGDSTLRYQDESLVPQFKIGLYKLNGSVKGLNTRPGHKAQLTLDAQVDRYAPFKASGTIAPDPLYVDMDVSLHNYEMTGLTSYTGMFLGYGVEKGQLGVSSKVDIDHGQLKSGSDIAANQFYLGDKVESDEAVKAPVKLGLAVLRNRHGDINLPLKVSGDLNDPSFSVSGLILKVIGNVLVKAATSPFSVLAGLAGGENLENIAFPLGRKDVDDDAGNSLQALAKVLGERPSLTVGLAGSTNAQDRQALAEQAIATDLAGTDWPGIEAAAQDPQWQRPLIRRYERESGRDAETLVKTLPEAESQRQQRLAQAAWDSMVKSEAAAISTDALRQLARDRADNAKVYLVQQLGVDQGRLYINRAQVDGKVAGLTLGLEKE
ncbi:hypothetical protein A11A3_05129 [Alcanivorax hongdengensis A-11-3]|uniref:DUF748 domain-containing protein n=1 Tax=Alcanivorax hongdengensis A-11-3 TaxID=1177179 RepID=L0WDZ1_9GAMM|nr:DUF748 domain-containing protein [Alcanivorax hongdengensis]EKF75048.1 hypothetical protein A11A3_05129 [Alcanivorax hongdengensis A-11-3]